MAPIRAKLLVTGVLAVFLAGMAFELSKTPRAEQRAAVRPKPAPKPVAPPSPVSAECKDLVDVAMKERMIIGTAGFDGRVGQVLVAHEWSRWPFDSQADIAECLGHVIAQSQDNTVNLRFFNQASGVTYGELTNGRYRLPERD